MSRAVLDDVREIFEKGFRDNWTQTVVVYDNVDIDPPQGGNWIRVTVIEFDAVNAEIGTNNKNLSGALAVQVFIPKGVGTKPANDLAEQIFQLFENKQFVTAGGATLFTYGGQTVRVGDGIRKVDQIERGQFQLNANIPWECQ